MAVVQIVVKITIHNIKYYCQYGDNIIVCCYNLKMYNFPLQLVVFDKRLFLIWNGFSARKTCVVWRGLGDCIFDITKNVCLL
jgi:hypothetical protein